MKALFVLALLSVVVSLSPLTNSHAEEAEVGFGTFYVVSVDKQKQQDEELAAIALPAYNKPAAKKYAVNIVSPKSERRLYLTEDQIIGNVSRLMAQRDASLDEVFVMGVTIGKILSGNVSLADPCTLDIDEVAIQFDNCRALKKARKADF